MEKKEIICDECEAVCKVVYDLDDMFYQVTFCPFCGVMIEKDDITDDNDDDDDELDKNEDDDFFHDYEE